MMRLGSLLEERLICSWGFYKKLKIWFVGKSNTDIFGDVKLGNWVFYALMLIMIRYFSYFEFYFVIINKKSTMHIYLLSKEQVNILMA